MSHLLFLKGHILESSLEPTHKLPQRSYMFLNLKGMQEYKEHKLHSFF